jgi:hypothetical protein
MHGMVQVCTWLMYMVWYMVDVHGMVHRVDVHGAWYRLVDVHGMVQVCAWLCMVDTWLMYMVDAHG